MKGEDSNFTDLYALNLKLESNIISELSSDPPARIGSFPTTTATTFRYSSSGFLVFTDLVYADGNLSSAKEQDKAWERRGTTALVYDDASPRFWDTW